MATNEAIILCPYSESELGRIQSALLLQAAVTTRETVRQECLDLLVKCTIQQRRCFHETP